jgi:hypothetical protein
MEYLSMTNTDHSACGVTRGQPSCLLMEAKLGITFLEVVATSRIPENKASNVKISRRRGMSRYSRVPVIRALIPLSGFWNYQEMASGRTQVFTERLQGGGAHSEISQLNERHTAAHNTNHAAH